MKNPQDALSETWNKLKWSVVDLMLHKEQLWLLCIRVLKYSWQNHEMCLGKGIFCTKVILFCCSLYIVLGSYSYKFRNFIRLASNVSVQFVKPFCTRCFLCIFLAVFTKSKETPLLSSCLFETVDGIPWMKTDSSSSTKKQTKGKLILSDEEKVACVISRTWSIYGE